MCHLDLINTDECFWSDLRVILAQIPNNDFQPHCLMLESVLFIELSHDITRLMSQAFKAETGFNY